MPTITSNLYFLKIIKLESEATGPVALIFDLDKFFIALLIIFFSSDFLGKKQASPESLIECIKFFNYIK